MYEALPGEFPEKLACQKEFSKRSIPGKVRTFRGVVVDDRRDNRIELFDAVVPLPHQTTREISFLACW